MERKELREFTEEKLLSFSFSEGAEGQLILVFESGYACVKSFQNGYGGETAMSDDEDVDWMDFIGIDPRFKVETFVDVHVSPGTFCLIEDSKTEDQN